jgi:hypothetical protein
MPSPLCPSNPGQVDKEQETPHRTMSYSACLLNIEARFSVLLVSMKG